MAFKLSLRERCREEAYNNKFLKVLEIYDLPLIFENADEQSVLNIMKSDKKNSFSKINLVLPVELGKVEVVDNISEDLILDIIKECKNA